MPESVAVVSLTVLSTAYFLKMLIAARNGAKVGGLRMHNGGRRVLSELRLPWPNKDMSPNARIHWARKAKAVKIARTFAFFKTQEAGWHKMELPEGRLHLWIDFYPPTKRMPDDDNMLSRCKAYRDGIADALGIDDKRFISHPFVKNEVMKGGEVRIRITGAP